MRTVSPKYSICVFMTNEESETMKKALEFILTTYDFDRSYKECFLDLLDCLENPRSLKEGESLW